MAASTAAQSTSLPTPNSRVPLTNKDGTMTVPTLQMLQRLITLVNGLTPGIPCNASFASNVYTLTPFSISPQFSNYLDYQSFPFVAPATSTGLITATVVPTTGTIATLPVYKANGATQATTNDILINLFYVIWYVDSLNSGAGGFVLK